VLIKHFNGISYDQRSAEGYYTFVNQMLAQGAYVVATPLFREVVNSEAERLDRNTFWAMATSSEETLSAAMNFYTAHFNDEFDLQPSWRILSSQASTPLVQMAQKFLVEQSLSPASTFFANSTLLKEAVALFDDDFLIEAFQKINNDDFISQFFNVSYGILTDFHELLQLACKKVPFIKEIYGRLFECGLRRLSAPELDRESFFTIQSYNGMYKWWAAIDLDNATSWLCQFKTEIPDLMAKFSSLYTRNLDQPNNQDRISNGQNLCEVSIVFKQSEDVFEIPFQFTLTGHQRSKMKMRIKQYLSQPNRRMPWHTDEVLLPALLSSGILTAKSSLMKQLRRRA
jgi:hypothetical protein